MDNMLSYLNGRKLGRMMTLTSLKMSKAAKSRAAIVAAFKEQFGDVEPARVLPEDAIIEEYRRELHELRLLIPTEGDPGLKAFWAGVDDAAKEIDEVIDIILDK